MQNTETKASGGPLQVQPPTQAAASTSQAPVDEARREMHHAEKKASGSPPQVQPKGNKKGQARKLGIMVVLAPPKTAWAFKCPRFELLRHALQSFDKKVNQGLKTKYPALILHENYTEEDKASLREVVSEATQLQFRSVDLGPPVGITQEQLAEWIPKKPGTKTVGYRRMCREWSGPFQNFKELDAYEYYMRMDDDSLWAGQLPFDPFVRMKERNLTYAYRVGFHDPSSRKSVWQCTKTFFKNRKMPLDVLKHYGWLGNMKGIADEEYNGMAPYNNFHVSRVDFWRSKEWTQYFQSIDKESGGFMRYIMGDANVHAMAIGIFMKKKDIKLFPDLPIKHNKNEDKSYPPKRWGKDCMTFAPV